MPSWKATARASRVLDEIQFTTGVVLSPFTWEVVARAIDEAVAEERDACAVVAECHARAWHDKETTALGRAHATEARAIVAAIRARGNETP